MVEVSMRSAKVAAGDYKSLAGNFKTVGDIKIIPLTMSKKFQTMV